MLVSSKCPWEALFVASSGFIVTCISMTGLLCSILLGVQSRLYIYAQNFHQSGNVQAYRNLSHME